MVLAAVVLPLIVSTLQKAVQLRAAQGYRLYIHGVAVVIAGAHGTNFGLINFAVLHLQAALTQRTTQCANVIIGALAMQATQDRALLSRQHPDVDDNVCLIVELIVMHKQDTQPGAVGAVTRTTGITN